jgi:predicted NUDIX family NTP pyrophosphohydrolase
MATPSAVAGNRARALHPRCVPKLSAGILLYRLQADHDRPEVLLVLRRSARASRPDAHGWSIPKGKPLPRERLIYAVRREFEEETACPAPPRLIELGEVVEPSGKRVAVWAADAAASSAERGVEQNGHRPAAEIAEVAWVDARRARELLSTGQVPLMSRLERLVKQRG